MNKVQGKTSSYVLAALMCWVAPVAFADQPSPQAQFETPHHFAPQQNADSQALVEELVEQGLPQEWLAEALGQASYTQSVLDAMEGAAERRLKWYEYRAIFLTQQRIEEGVEFIDAHADAWRERKAPMVCPLKSLPLLLALKLTMVAIKASIACWIR